MPDDFVHLHNHTHHSLLDGLGKPDGYAQRAADLGQSALGINDHGTLSGAYQHWKECNAAGIKPIIGCELYVAPEDRRDKRPVFWGKPDERRDDISGQGAYTHLTILAENATGLRNLYRLQADSYSQGFYRKPRTDYETLAAHSEGLICLTGCPSSATSTLLRLEQADRARTVAGTLNDIFPDRLWVELMYHGTEFEAEIVKKQISELAQPLNLPTVVTNDAHYVNEADSSVHAALLCIQTGSTLSNPTFSFDGSGYFLKSRSEMEAGSWDASGLNNTLAIAERVQPYDEIFAHQLRMPSLGSDEAYRFWEEAEAGLIERVGLQGYDNQEYFDRLEYETSVIRDMGYPGYFRVLAKVIRRTKDEGIRIGPGRGSAGGSLVAYALGITDLDPIAHGLLFERFLNPSRISLPDIDIDVDEGKRPRFLELVREEFGEEYVAQIGTLGTIKAKAALKDANRVLGGTYSVGESLTRNLPGPKFGRDPSLEAYRGPETETVTLARGLEGTIRNEGIHAAGVIISPEPLSDIIPLRRPKGTEPFVTGFTMEEVADLGLVKFDFLGLRNLGIIDDTLSMVQNRTGTTPELPTLPRACNDPRTYRLLGEGHSLGVFQLDSPGMRGLLRSLQPNSFGDIRAVLALFRPGPMDAGAHTEYAKRKRSGAQWDMGWAIHPELSESLQPVLEETFGLIVYQEQVLEVLRVVCGWDYGDAEQLFTAMRKKKLEKMLATKPEYFAAGKSKGFSDDALGALWETLVPFADYSFPKAHSAGYGLVAYWTAFLKANHPVEYMSALLSSVAEDPDKLPGYLTECRRLGIEITNPDINTSGLGFSPGDGSTIHYGLGAIKGVGGNAYQAIVSKRPYSSLDDLFKRAPAKVLNSGVLSALIRSGAIDSLCPLREELYVAREAVAARALRYRAERKAGAVPLFPVQFGVGDSHLFSESTRRGWEMETLSVVLTTERRTISANQRLSEQQFQWLKMMIDQHPGDTELHLQLGSVKMRAGHVNWDTFQSALQRSEMWQT